MASSIEDMPSSYDQPPPPSSTNAPPTNPNDGLIDKEFLRSYSGILKIIQMVFNLVTFICASVHFPFIALGGGWVQFVSMTAFICTAILYVFHSFKIPPKFPDTMPFKFSEFIYCVMVSVWYFISGVICSVYGSLNAAIGAAAFFCFASMILYGADSYYTFMVWRRSGEKPYFSSLHLNCCQMTSFGGSGSAQSQTGNDGNPHY